MRRLFLNRLEPAKKSGQNIPKNRCRTTIAERMMETLAELPLTGDQVGLFKAQPGRPQRRAEVASGCAEMNVSVGCGIQKNRCRTTVAEPIGETRAELPLTGDQVVCLSHEPGRPQLPTAIIPAVSRFCGIDGGCENT